MTREMEIRDKLIDALLWSGNEETLKGLEHEAIVNDIFDKDNGEDVKRKSNESLGVYIERCNIALMKNFSREKYEKVKGLCLEYNNYGDSKIEITESVQKRPKMTRKRVAFGVGITAALVGAAGILKKVKSKK